MVRIKPENINGKEGDCEIKKVSSDALCIGDMKFTFDEVFDVNSNQVGTSLHCVTVIRVLNLKVFLDVRKKW